MALILPPPSKPLAVGQDVTFLVTTSDAALSSYATAVLTIRADPDWPRIGSYKVKEPDSAEIQAWPIVLQVSDYTKTGATTYELTADRDETAAVPWGYRRCVLDVWRTDSGNTYPDVYPTWLDVVSPVYPEP